MSVIIGSILGDGYVRTIAGRSDAFLEVNHAYNQKKYVDWKYEILQNVTKSKPKKRSSNGGRIAYRFFTKQLPEISSFEDRFYDNKSKTIPQNLSLDPIMLAVWYMDDGSMCRASDVYLNTQQFSKTDQINLLDALSEIGIEGRLNRDKKYYRIRLLKSSIANLIKMIKPHVIPSMQYKIALDPVET